MTNNERYLPIDEEGYFVFDGRRVDDENLGRELLGNIKPDEQFRFTTSLQGQSAWVEAFDEPLIARHVSAAANGFVIDLPYGMTAEASPAALTVDEWDRFHGLTSEGIPFVFSRQAQYEFFDLLNEFDDDSVTMGGRRYPVPPWLAPGPDVQADGFWTKIYQTETPGWELERESVILPEVLPQLKMNKSRVLVLGCGSGNDAAYFAKQGHVVTAVDFSPEAIQRGTAKYGSIENLNFIKADIFKLPETMAGQFDLIFEHACYCAIEPTRRKDLVQLWSKLLAPQGHLLGVFFVHERRIGPPWGGSEWEVRERLKGRFDFLYWMRWRHSIERRKAKELIVYARKK